MLHSADIFVKLVLCPAFSSLFQYCFLEPQMLFLFCKQRRCCGRMMGHTHTARLSDRQTDARRFINPAPHTVDSAKNARYVLPPSQEKNRRLRPSYWAFSTQGIPCVICRRRIIACETDRSLLQWNLIAYTITYWLTPRITLTVIRLVMNALWTTPSEEIFP